MRGEKELWVNVVAIVRKMDFDEIVVTDFREIHLTYRGNLRAKKVTIRVPERWVNIWYVVNKIQEGLDESRLRKLKVTEDSLQ